MAISRMHPVANWCRLSPHEHRRALDKVLQLRDAAPDPMVSGLPEAAVQWWWQEELPRLLQRPEVRQQAEQRLQELQDTCQHLQDQIQVQAGCLIEQQAAAELEYQQLCALVETTNG